MDDPRMVIYLDAQHNVIGKRYDSFIGHHSWRLVFRDPQGRICQYESWN
jgi:hypothetical protein